MLLRSPVVFQTGTSSISLQNNPLDFLLRKGRKMRLNSYIGLSILRCYFHEVVNNPMFSEMTLLLTESLELVEGNEASGPAGPTGEESFDCERGRGASGGIVYKITAAFREPEGLLQQAGSDLTFERESRRGGVHVAP